MVLLKKIIVVMLICLSLLFIIGCSVEDDKQESYLLNITDETQEETAPDCSGDALIPDEPQEETAPDCSGDAFIPDEPQDT